MDTKRVKEIDGMLANQPKTWIADKLKAERAVLIALPVAAGSVESLPVWGMTKGQLSCDDFSMVCGALTAWGAQQREAEKLKVEQSVVMAVDQAHQQAKDAEDRATKLREWAEKAEARVKSLENSLHKAENNCREKAYEVFALERRIESMQIFRPHIGPYAQKKA